MERDNAAESLNQIFHYCEQYKLTSDPLRVEAVISEMDILKPKLSAWRHNHCTFETFCAILVNQPFELWITVQFLFKKGALEVIK